MNSKMTLGDIAEVVMGQSPIGESCNQKGLGLPLLNGPTEFGFKHPQPVQFTTDSKRESNNGDLLFCVRGSTTGKMNWANQPYSIGRGLAAIRGKNGYPNIFIRAIIEYKLDSLLAKATGSTFPNVSRDLICSLDIPRTSCGKAIQIAAIIEPIDDRISLLRETNTTLEAIAQTIFKSWFVDFDPVKAKAEGRLPEGMDEATAALFPSEFEGSALGLIPKGWRVMQFGDFIQRLSVGKKYDQKSALLYGRVPILDQGKSGLIGFHNNEASVNATLDNPVVVFANHTCYMRLVTFCFSAIQNVLPFKGRDVDTVWAFYATKDRIEFSEYKGHWPDFVIEKAIVPPENLTKAFKLPVAAFIESMRNNEDSIQTLTTLRDTLLPRLISGQLRLNQAQDLVDEVVAS